MTSSSRVKLANFVKSSQTDFRKSQFDSNKVSSCILDNFYTLKSKTRTLCTFATISRLVQINNKLNIKTIAKLIKWHETNKNYSYVLDESMVTKNSKPPRPSH